MPKKENKIKVYFNREIENVPLPELLNYENILYTPQKLADINAGEGGKLTGIEEGADNFSSVAKDMAYEDLVEYAKLGTTLQVGGYLKTILIDADYIKAGTLVGRTVKTSDEGDEVVLETGGPLADYLLFYHSDILEAKIWAGAGLFTIQGSVDGILSIGTQTDPALLYMTSAGISAGTHLIMGAHNITLGAGRTVDGVDISVLATNYNALVANYADHVGDDSAHHSKYTDANARSAVTDYNLPGDLDLNNHDVVDVRYLIFDSSYGQISRGTDLMFDFFGDRVEVARHFTPHSPNSCNCGSDGDYWKEVHYKSLVPHSPNVLKDSEGLEILYSIKKKKDGKIDPINVDKRVKTEKGKNGRLELTQLVMANISATKELDSRLKKLERQ